MITYETLLGLTYWATAIVWSLLTVIFVKRYFRSRHTTMLALAIACLTQSFSTTYFSFMVNAEYYFLPYPLYEVLSAPYMWLIPKIGLVFGALAIYLALWRRK